MVALEVIQKSNALLKTLPQTQGLVAVFTGATSGIGQSALEHLAREVPGVRIYSTARAKTVADHEAWLQQFRAGNPTGSFTVIPSDASLVADMDRAAAAVQQAGETHVDLLVMSAGFFAFEGRIDSVEGLDPSMTTRYYARLRAVQQLLPLLNAAPLPRIVNVLAAGEESPLCEDDLDLRDPKNWTMWSASRHACTMGTLSLEHIAAENPNISIMHCHPGAVTTPGMARNNAHGLNPPNPRTQDEAGQRLLFLATSDVYGVKPGLVPVPEGMEVLKKSGGGLFMVGSDGQLKDNEKVLVPMRERGLVEKVWNFTQDIFERCVKTAN